MTVKRKVVKSSLQISSLSNPSSRLSFEDFAPPSLLYELYFNRFAQIPLRGEDLESRKGACILAAKRARRGHDYKKRRRAKTMQRAGPKRKKKKERKNQVGKDGRTH